MARRRPKKPDRPGAGTKQPVVPPEEIFARIVDGDAIVKEARETCAAFFANVFHGLDQRIKDQIAENVPDPKRAAYMEAFAEDMIALLEQRAGALFTEVGQDRPTQKSSTDARQNGPNDERAGGGRSGPS